MKLRLLVVLSALSVLLFATEALRAQDTAMRPSRLLADVGPCLIAMRPQNQDDGQPLATAGG